MCFSYYSHMMVDLCVIGEAWQLEEEEDMGGSMCGSRPSGHVDEALFTARIPRHYFHSTQGSTGTSSQSHSGTSSHTLTGATHSESSVTTFQQPFTGS